MERQHQRQQGTTTDERTTQLPSVSGAPRRQPPPLPADPLVGREREIADLRALLLDPATRIVSVLGPGGVGKTRLALTLAHEVANGFTHGVLFLRLDRSEPGSLWQTLGEHLSLTPPHEAPWADIVTGALAGRHLLLVLDNCESAPGILDDLPQLLERCPGIVVLATSRETLRLHNERETWLDPLPVPGVDTASADTAILDSPAVQLFLLRARHAHPGFMVTPAHHGTLMAIVRKLDGLPLAIELTAAYARHLSPEGILTLLDEAMATLGGGPRTLPARHQSLRQLVHWSLDALPPDVRAGALSLAIFPDGFSPGSVAAVLGSTSRHQAWSLIMTLADKSLITRTTGAEGGDARFSILQTIRSVLLEELEATPALHASALERLARALVRRAREADDHYHGPEGRHWLRVMREEHQDVQLIVTRALDTPALRPMALELCGTMFWFWYTQGHYQWALPLIERLLSFDGQAVDSHVVAHAHVTAGWLAHRMAQIERAEHHFLAARALFGPEPDRASLLGAIGYAYILSFDQQDTSGAARELERVIAEAPSVPNAWHEEAAGHFGLGLDLYFAGRFADARHRFMETLRLGRIHNDGQSIGMALMYLAHVDRAEGKPAEAYWKLREALPLLMEMGDLATTALLLDIVASVLVSLDAHELAMQSLAVGEHLRSTMGIPRAPVEEPDTEETRARIAAWRDSTEGDYDAHAVIDLGETIDRLLQFRPETAAPSRPDAPADREQQAGPATVLSPRELEVLHLVSTGMTSSEIASALFLSPHTVKRHMANIREKLGVRSQAAAIAALRGMDTSSGMPGAAPGRVP